MKKAKKSGKTPYLNDLTKKAKIEKKKRTIYRVYVSLSTIVILFTLLMIAVNPTRYLNLVVVLLLSSVALIATENMQLHRLKKPQDL